MTLFRRFADLAGESAEQHLAIGVFDGVHLGHQAVLGSAVAAARERGGSSLMVTFDPHPTQVLRPGNAPRLLTCLKHKLQLAADRGVDRALVLPFTQDFSQASGAEFVDSLLSGGARLGSVSVGQDWRFGCDRSGDVQVLRDLGLRHGFSVNGVPPLRVNGQLVSSTHIRSLVESGQLETAGRYLGRRFSLLGTVQRGQRLGRTLGFPTANLDCAELQLPPWGVYAGQAILQGVTRPAVANLGCRPTVGDGAVSLEVHLLDYEGPDFYGQDLEIAFLRLLRAERKFPSAAALSEQIRLDIRQAREVLSGLA